MKNSVVLFLIALVWLVAPQPVLAEETENKATPWKKVSLNLGGFLAATDSSVRLGTTTTGIGIDVEDTLGLEKSTIAFRMDAFWRFSQNRRHRADFTWFSLKRDGTRTLLKDIEIDGTVFPTGSTVQTKFDFDIFKGSYSYSFVHDDRMDLAVAAGLYIAPLSLAIDSQGALSGSGAESITAPLPVVGLRADFAITPKWFLKTNFDLFYLEIDGYTGVITDIRLAVEYNAFKHVGFGLGFDSLNVSIESDQNTSVPGVDFNGKIDFAYAGLLAYAKFYF
jgi:hypothetical protein